MVQCQPGGTASRKSPWSGSVGGKLNTMGKTHETLSPDLQAWLSRQKIFFVATAPLQAAGHINCSPKGGDTLRIISEREIAYLDLTGSGHGRHRRHR